MDAKKKRPKSKSKVNFAPGTKDNESTAKDNETNDTVAVELDTTGMFFRHGAWKQGEEDPMLGGIHQVFLNSGGMNRDEDSSINYALEAKNRWGGLKSHVVVYAVAAVILVPLVVITQVVLMQNFVFTTDYLTEADVPFYDGQTINASIWWRTPRVYGLWWFLVAFGLLRIVTVIGPVIASYETAGKLRAVDTLSTALLPYSVMRIFEALYGLLEFGTAILALWVAYIPSLISNKQKLCAEVQLCRDPKTSSVGDTAVDSAYLFRLFAWFTLAFSLVHLLYFLRLRAGERLVSKMINQLSASIKNSEV
jgi:hypothetical protein